MMIRRRRGRGPKDLACRFENAALFLRADDDDLLLKVAGKRISMSAISAGSQAQNKLADDYQLFAMDPSVDFENLSKTKSWLAPIEPKDDVRDMDSDHENQSDLCALIAHDGENDSFASWSAWSGSEPYYEVSTLIFRVFLGSLAHSSKVFMQLLIICNQPRRAMLTL